MPISKQLIEVLVCPISKQPVAMLDTQKLATLNQLIAEGAIETMDGNIVKDAIEEALITRNQNTIYRIEHNIPIMLEDQSIAADQLLR